MKTPIVLVSIGLLSSTLASLTGYFAWNSLRGQPNATPVVATAQSQPTLVSPITSSHASVATPAVNLAPASPMAAVSPPGSAVTAWSQPENDYLFDLAQALQPAEYQRLNATQQLEMARQIQSWIGSGADFWSLRQQFDAAYSGTILGDYAHNREVYIRFVAERFAPSQLALLMVPPGQPYDDPVFGLPYAPPDAEPFPPEAPYDSPFQPYPDAYGYTQPDPYGQPYPLPGSDYPNQDPGYLEPPNYSDSDPGRPFAPPDPGFQPPQPYSPPPPNDRTPAIPNLTEVST